MVLDPLKSLFVKCSVAPNTDLEYVVHYFDSATVNTTKGSESKLGTFDENKSVLIAGLSERRYRDVQIISIFNTDNQTQTVTITYEDIETSGIVLYYKVNLKSGESAKYEKETGWTVYDSFGIKKKDKNISFEDNGQTDAFGRLKTASPTTLFDAQFTYDLQPLVYESVVANISTSSITHDSTNRRAKISFIGAGAAIGDKTFMQSYEYFRYQPGKSQEINITFNFGTAKSGVLKYAQYGDSSNAIGFFQEGNGTLSFRIISGTTSGNQTANQSGWNIDKLDGTGKSGITLDVTTDNILYMDLQALYVGRVRFGFVIDGILRLCHEFDNANALTTPYIQSANLPIRVGLEATSNLVIADMYFNCCMVASNGGIDEAVGYEFSTPDAAVTAANGSRTHLVSVRPKTTFNSITNRSKLASLEIDLIVTGNNPVYWELCVGQANSASSFSDINTSYSAFQYASGANFTPSGSPAIVVDSGYIPSSASNKGSANMKLTDRYPITLNTAGTVRDLGTITLFVTGLGASSACRAVLKHKEIR